MSVQDYIEAFVQLYHKVEHFYMQLPDTVLAYKIYTSITMQEAEVKTCAHLLREYNYGGVANQLVKIFESDVQFEKKKPKIDDSWIKRSDATTTNNNTSNYTNTTAQTKVDQNVSFGGMNDEYWTKKSDRNWTQKLELKSNENLTATTDSKSNEILTPTPESRRDENWTKKNDENLPEKLNQNSTKKPGSRWKDLIEKQRQYEKENQREYGTRSDANLSKKSGNKSDENWTTKNDQNSTKKPGSRWKDLIEKQREYERENQREYGESRKSTKRGPDTGKKGDTVRRESDTEKRNDTVKRGSIKSNTTKESMNGTTNEHICTPSSSEDDDILPNNKIFQCIECGIDICYV